MNPKTSKLIRKWCSIRSLDYKTAKNLYNSLDGIKRSQMKSEMEKYIQAVQMGTVIPSKPKLQ